MQKRRDLEMHRAGILAPTAEAGLEARPEKSSKWHNLRLFYFWMVSDPL